MAKQTARYFLEKNSLLCLANFIEKGKNLSKEDIEENKKELAQEILKGIYNLLYLYKNQKLLIVSHSITIELLLSNWCNIDNKGIYQFKNQVIFNGKWHDCETFKLVFDDNDELCQIQNV